MNKRTLLLITLFSASISLKANDTVTRAINNLDQLRSDIGEISSFLDITIDLQIDHCKRALRDFNEIRKNYIKAVEEKRDAIKAILDKLAPVNQLVKNKYQDIIVEYEQINQFLEAMSKQ